MTAEPLVDYARAAARAAPHPVCPGGLGRGAAQRTRSRPSWPSVPRSRRMPGSWPAARVAATSPFVTTRTHSGWSTSSSARWPSGCRAVPGPAARRAPRGLRRRWPSASSFALAPERRRARPTCSSGGQDWGFPPLHPERLRADRHRYPIACLRQHAPRARPADRPRDGPAPTLLDSARLSATDGVYVRIPPTSSTRSSASKRSATGRWSSARTSGPSPTACARRWPRAGAQPRPAVRSARPGDTPSTCACREPRIGEHPRHRPVRGVLARQRTPAPRRRRHVPARPRPRSRSASA